MFLIEVEAFINAIKIRKLDAIQSLYEDLALSYQATQWITTASSENRHQKPDHHTWVEWQDFNTVATFRHAIVLVGWCSAGIPSQEKSHNIRVMQSRAKVQG